jgi:large subunit ribosomal protein L10
MDNPRPEKVAVVDEVRQRFSDADAVLLTEYRGINVGELAALRGALRDAGGVYKVYKNTLVRFAARDLGLELDDQLTGPTAIAFVPAGGGGDPVTVAKALRDFAKGNPNLVVKGGVLGGRLLSADDAKALADVAPREELLAKLAGLMAAPMQQFAGLLQALPRDFAYGLQALIEKGGAPGAPVSEEPPAAPEEAGTVEATEPSASETSATDTTEADADEAPATTDTPDAATEAASDTDDAAPADDAGADPQES